MQRQNKILITAYILLVFIPLTILLGLAVLFWNVSLSNALILLAGVFGLVSVGLVAQIKFGKKQPTPTSKQIMMKFIWAPLLAAIRSVLSLSLNMPTVITAALFFGVLIAARVKYHFA
jgi:hypothetical protein